MMINLQDVSGHEWKRRRELSEPYRDERVRILAASERRSAAVAVTVVSRITGKELRERAAIEAGKA
jgi:hypothetical protein